DSPRRWRGRGAERPDRRAAQPPPAGRAARAARVGAHDRHARGGARCPQRPQRGAARSAHIPCGRGATGPGARRRDPRPARAPRPRAARRARAARPRGAGRAGGGAAAEASRGHREIAPPPGTRPLPQGVERVSWPSVELDPVRRLRVLAAAIPGAAVAEAVLEAPFGPVWEAATDFENAVPRIELFIGRAEIVSRE